MGIYSFKDIDNIRSCGYTVEEFEELEFDAQIAILEINDDSIIDYSDNIEVYIDR